MTDNRNRSMVVGSYLEREHAQSAIEHLGNAGVTGARLEREGDSVWQVYVPWTQADQALQSLLDAEKKAVHQL